MIQLNTALGAFYIRINNMKLNSHVLHPQIKIKHDNAESAKLTNHDTTPPPPPPAPSSDRPDKPSPVTGGY